VEIMSATIEPIPRTGPRPDETRSLPEIGGIEISGVDLSENLSRERKGWLMRTFRAHPVIVFRDRHLSKERQYEFTLTFGEIEGLHVNRLVDAVKYTPVHTVSNIGSDGKPSAPTRERGNYYWHSDKSYHDVPSLLTMLHGVEIPSRGGETQFANTAMAYAALDEATKQRISGLRAVHSWERSRIQARGLLATEEQKRERPPVDHPIVRTHPDTGAKVLYLGNHASHVLGWPEEDGRALLRWLEAFATQPAFVYSHRWRPGDLVLWDNRCTIHRALPHEDMDKERRVLHRTVVKGTVPY
jgi:alpha-ketoglutarate-dependent 2,4-dichlorophenoxyacetate dioxygenase